MTPSSIENRLNVWTGAGPDMRLFRDEFERQLSALNDGGLLWELFGKHLAAHKAHGLATMVVEERAAVVANFLVQEQYQKANAELLLQQLEIEDRIETERLNRDLMRLRNALLMVSSTFNEEMIGDVSPETRDDLVEAITAALIRRTVGESPPPEPPAPTFE